MITPVLAIGFIGILAALILNYAEQPQISMSPSVQDILRAQKWRRVHLALTLLLTADVAMLILSIIKGE